MRDNYDFSNGVRGKFYHPNATHKLPVYLEAEVMSYFEEKAKAKGIELDAMLNELLKKDIALIEAIK